MTGQGSKQLMDKVKKLENENKTLKNGKKTYDQLIRFLPTPHFFLKQRPKN